MSGLNLYYQRKKAIINPATNTVTDLFNDGKRVPFHHDDKNPDSEP